jgi:hypothetical protein
MHPAVIRWTVYLIVSGVIVLLGVLATPTIGAVQ